MELLQRDEELALLAEAVLQAADGSGRVVLIRGEAGIGKSSLLAEFTARHEGEVHLLSGTCDDLLTPRPFEAFWDMGDDDPEILAALEAEDQRDLFRALTHLLDRRARPTVIVIDDIHWADQATLDVVKRVGRRIDRMHGLLVLAFRDEDTPPDASW